MVRNPNENVRDTVVVKISDTSYRKAKKTTKLCWVGGLKIWVIELSDDAQSGTADKPNLSHILGRAKPVINCKISILERSPNCEIGNSVTVHVPNDRDRKSKVCRRRFRSRIEQGCRLDSGGEER